MRGLLVLAGLALVGCGRIDHFGRAPEFSPMEGTLQHAAVYSARFPEVADQTGPGARASLWSAERGALFGDRRATRRGDILTVLIEIDDSAQISNSTERSRDGSERLGIPQMMGIPQRADTDLPAGASLANAVQTDSQSSYQGEGSVSRNEQLELKIAATVVEELANGVLRIEGQQEVRVNRELRELLLSGYVRPVDISRQNEITYDKIAGARISYGGRGLVSDVQSPRYGQELADIVLPF